jgi:hypothetical protein
MGPVSTPVNGDVLLLTDQHREQMINESPIITARGNIRYGLSRSAISILNFSHNPAALSIKRLRHGPSD